jgi:predicted nucleic acid-binding Zn ribbon protein
MARHNDYTLKEALQSLVNSYKLDGKLNEVKVINSWQKLMGPVVANRTGNIFIRDKKLFVTLTSAPLREELSMAKSKIIEMINKEAGAEVITDVVFH